MNTVKAKTSQSLNESPPVDSRIKKIQKKMQKIDSERKRIIYGVSADIALGQASSRPIGSGRAEKQSKEKNEFDEDFFVLFGDQGSVVRLEEVTPENAKSYSNSFPGKIPSQKDGIIYDPLNFSKDYASFMKHSPAEVYENEDIVGEYHWSFADLRERVFPDDGELDILGDIARELGAGGYPVTHTCVDFSIGIKLGWEGILKKIRENNKKFERLGKEKEVSFLQAVEINCLAIIDYIEKHSKKALSLAEKEKDESQKKRYLKIAGICQNIAKKPPASFHEGIQWVWFYMLVEQMQTGGTGYGRIDQNLYQLYKNDRDNNILTRDEARNLIGELYLKYATFYSIGGRDREGKDATNELSWLFVEAYDMLGCNLEFGVLWHSDINPEFFRYVCAVTARHGNGAPGLVNQDILRDSEIYYGVKPEDAWNVAFTGCF